MSVQHQFRLGLRRLGIDLARYPSSDPMFGVVRLLTHFGIDCVVDVGANSGGFASTIRSLGYSGRIVSLEPLSGPFGLLAARAARGPDWKTPRIAAGDNENRRLVTVDIEPNGLGCPSWGFSPGSRIRVQGGFCERMPCSSRSRRLG